MQQQVVRVLGLLDPLFLHFVASARFLLVHHQCFACLESQLDNLLLELIFLVLFMLFLLYDPLYDLFVFFWNQLLYLVLSKLLDVLGEQMLDWSSEPLSQSLLYFEDRLDYFRDFVTDCVFMKGLRIFLCRSRIQNFYNIVI